MNADTNICTKEYMQAYPHAYIRTFIYLCVCVCVLVWV